MSMRKAVRIIPLGGLQEIGMNMMLLGSGDDYVAIDAGVQFVEPGMVGADLILPDLDVVLDFADRLRAIVVTHAHEDHIGAIEHIVRLCPVPVYAPPFAAEVMRVKAEEFGAVARPDVRVVAPGEKRTIGPFSFEFIAMPHSIPDACALAIDTPAGLIFHTGDYKSAQNGGPAFPRDRLVQLSKKGVRLMFQDSTNVLVGGKSEPETVLKERLLEIIGQAPGRVVVGLFSSNVTRVANLLDIARTTGRKVALLGTSVHMYMKAATRRGIGFPQVEQVALERLSNVKDDELLVVCTGSQAEERSVLARASVSTHPKLRIREKDLVILSSRIIPGNEKAIFRMINNLTALGATVLHQLVAPVHVSGHAKRDELIDTLRLVRPKLFVPVHGDLSFLAAHVALAQDVPGCEPLLLKNGDVLDVTRESAEVVDHIVLNPHYVDGDLVGTSEELKLAERRKMGWTGVVCGHIDIKKRRNKLRARARLQAVGCARVDEEALLEACQFIQEEIGTYDPQSPRRQIEDWIQRSLALFMKRKTGRKPVVTLFVDMGKN